MSSDLELGTPGGSARRRAAARGARPTWEVGARGEEMLAEGLAKRCPGAIVLHDRRIPGRRSNIDHIAVAANGVWVIDAKRHRGKVQVRKPLFGEPELRVNGWDRTKLIRGLERQVEVVEQALQPRWDELPVQGCLCFVCPPGLLAESGLPVFRTLSIGGFELLLPGRLARRINAPGDFGDSEVAAIAAHLAQRLPAA